MEHKKRFFSVFSAPNLMGLELLAFQISDHLQPYFDKNITKVAKDLKGIDQEISEALEDLKIACLGFKTEFRKSLGSAQTYLKDFAQELNQENSLLSEKGIEWQVAISNFFSSDKLELNEHIDDLISEAGTCLKEIKNSTYINTEQKLLLQGDETTIKERLGKMKEASAEFKAIKSLTLLDALNHKLGRTNEHSLGRDGNVR